MITSRVGATLALIFSLAALALAVVAFMSTVRNDSPTAGRLVQTQLDNTYTGAPVAFPLDSFFLGRGSDGVLHAFYAYPPGYYGHTRGCKVVWDSAATVDTPQGKSGPGMYLEPCGGAHFDRDGALISGPADRGLDYFATQPAVDGVLVDTRTLFCGEAPVSYATPESSASDTPTATPTPGPVKCERVSADTKKP